MQQSFMQRREERNATTKSVMLSEDYTRVSHQPYSNAFLVPLHIFPIERVIM